MFYRYEARRIDGDVPSDWEGIFQHFDPTERRQWYCLCEPKWYAKNPDKESQAWFTQHGYDKWHEKMDDMIEDKILCMGSNRLEVRLLSKESLENIVFKGKTQVLIAM